MDTVHTKNTILTDIPDEVGPNQIPNSNSVVGHENIKLDKLNANPYMVVLATSEFGHNKYYCKDM